MPTDADTLEALEERARAEIAGAGSLAALQEARARLLGRKGSVAALLRSIGELAPAERARAGVSGAEPPTSKAGTGGSLGLRARARPQPWLAPVLPAFAG